MPCKESGKGAIFWLSMMINLFAKPLHGLCRISIVSSSCLPNLGDALSCMAKESFIPDAVIVDFHLDDGSSGIDVIRILRLRFKADLPAVIITGDASIAEADGSGVQGIRCLSKPVGYADLGGLIAAFKSGIVSAPIIPVPAMPGKSPPASQLS